MHKVTSVDHLVEALARKLIWRLLQLSSSYFRQLFHQKKYWLMKVKVKQYVAAKRLDQTSKAIEILLWIIIWAKIIDINKM